MDLDCGFAFFLGGGYRYSNLLLQLGYMTLFAVAFPAASFFAFLANLVTIRADSRQQLLSFKRPRFFPSIFGNAIWSDTFQLIWKNMNLFLC